MIFCASARDLATSGSYPGSFRTISLGIAHWPSGPGSMAVPTSPCPSPRMSMKAWRSRVIAIALRSSRLSKGGFCVTSRLGAKLVGVTSQTASGSWVLMSFSSGTVTS